MKTISAALDQTDSKLVELARDGDQAAYGRLISRHQTLVVSLAYSICGDFARSQDIAQEAFIVAWRQLNTLDDSTKFKSWLCGITRNLGHNFIRQQSRREQPASPAEASSEPAADTPSPREHAVTREESAIVWRALSELPETYREPLILFYREHQSVERVAAALDLSEDTVKQRLSRGRGMLRVQVESLVERSLGFTTPSVMFTTAVLGALPVLATPIIAASSATAVAKGGVAAKASFGLGTLLPSFLLHFAAAFGGYFWQSKRKTPPSKWLLLIAFTVWSAIAATAAVLWFLARP
jgi:RNA polymerase sigma factor (sigma-70 family)